MVIGERLQSSERRLFRWFIIALCFHGLRSGFKRLAQRSVAGTEFRLKVIAILVDDVIEGDDGVKAHGKVN